MILQDEVTAVVFNVFGDSSFRSVSLRYEAIKRILGNKYNANMVKIALEELREEIIPLLHLVSLVF